MSFVGEGTLDAKTEAILQRQDAIRTMGNLTIVHYGVNRSLQNRPFEEKRNALFNHSNLQLNRNLMQCSTWGEDEINKRGEALAAFALQIWPSPMQITVE
jgi:hypothetical protein